MQATVKNGYRYIEEREMSTSRRQWWVILAHVVIWAVFLSLPTLFNPRRAHLGLSAFIDDLLEPPRRANALLLIAVYYFNYYIAIPKLYLRNNYLALTGTILLSFGCFFLVNYAIQPPMPALGPGMPAGFPGPPPEGFLHLGNSFNLFMFIIVYAFSFAISIYEQWQKTKEEQLNAEVSFLKAQINPHFLFNTLNSIYSLALVKSDNAPDAIIKLSGMMRYSISEANQARVSLSKEIAYISNYIELQRLRFTDKVKISFDVSGDPDGKQVAPFLLIPFVENAFKHGVNYEENSDIRISIAVEGKEVKLLVSNNKVSARPDKETGIGLGAATTHRRLQLLYPGEHTLEIDDNAAKYSIALKILLP